MGMNFFDAAAGLVSVGFRVFPLVPGAKLPLVKAWQKVATDDQDYAEPVREPAQFDHHLARTLSRSGRAPVPSRAR
jgi:hypothetical protein